MPTISSQTKRLISQYKLWQQLQQPKEGAATIHVDEVASRVAAFYEKIRGIIDWREEHLLKIGAIERMLKRRLFAKMDLTNAKISSEGVAGPLVLELIRSGVFPNDKIAESKIQEVQKTIDKYAFIINNSPASKQKSRLQLYHWLSSIAACELEDILSPSIKERALIEYMFELMRERIKLNEGIIKISGMKEEEKNMQIYVAVQKALFKLDPQIISYHILKYIYSNWSDLSASELSEFSHAIFVLWENLEKWLNHPLADKFYQVCERYDTSYLILGDIVSEDPAAAEEKISNPESLTAATKKFYTSRLKTLKSRLGRAALYSTISIFITKIAVALAIEIPLDKYLLGQFNSFAITIDALFPPVLMFFLIATIRPPQKGNLDKVIMEVIKITYESQRKDVYEIKTSKKRSLLLRLFIGLFYLLSFVISLGLIIVVLHALNFPIFSYFIFIMFISLIAFAGTRLRQRARELQITEEKEGGLSIILDLFALPLIQVGNWLTAKWRKYNIISAIFNALIDMPFSVFVEFLEQWRYFLKELKEKIH